jgi:hemoglobin/transferrin/lactoferrin receptor protein
LTLAGTVAGQAREDLDWLVTASGRQGHGHSTMGTADTPDTRRTTANPQDDTDKALLAKLVYRPGGGQKHVLTAEHVGKRSDINLLSSRSILPLSGAPAVIAGAILDERARNTAERDRLTWDAHVPVNSALADTVHTVLGVQHAKARQTGWSDRKTLPDRERDTTYSERTWQASVAGHACGGPGPRVAADRDLRSGPPAHGRAQPVHRCQPLGTRGVPAQTLPRHTGIGHCAVRPERMAKR